MSEDFVSFEIAKKLKEKGFNWFCSHYYRTKSKDLFMVFPCEDWSDTEERINAPTISQVLKWLREKKTISVEPCATPYNCWYYMIKCKGEIKVTYTGNKYKTYEAAAIAGIEYARDNLI